MNPTARILSGAAEFVTLGLGNVVTAFGKLGYPVNPLHTFPLVGSQARQHTLSRQEAVALTMAVGPPLPCRFVLALTNVLAKDLAEHLLGSDDMDEMLVTSALAELTNIMCCDFLEFVARHMNCVLQPYPPTMNRGSLDTLLATDLVHDDAKHVVLLPFTMKGHVAEGLILVCLDAWEAEFINI